MAVDEILLDECRRGAIDGVLRVYQWAPPAVSLGHGQSTDLLDLRACEKLGIDVVRRITGGGAILHWEEITYCLVLGRETLPVLKWPRQFARLMGVALCEALSSLGVDASLSPGETRAAVPCSPRLGLPVKIDASLSPGETRAIPEDTRSSRGTRSSLSLGEALRTPEDTISCHGTRSFHGAQSSLCFSSGAENEVVVGERKLAGCAHKFTREAFFSHGSIMTGYAHLRIVDLVRPEVGSMTMSALGERSVCLSDLLQTVPGFETVGHELRKGIENSFGVSLEESRLSGREEELAGERAATKANDADAGSGRGSVSGRDRGAGSDRDRDRDRGGGGRDSISARGRGIGVDGGKGKDKDKDIVTPPRVSG